MAVSVRDAVEAWKSRPLRPSDIPLETACARIGTANPLFEARRTGPVEWVLCRAGEDVPAIFSYAATFASADPVETGNLMEPEDEKNNSTDTSRLERAASFKCNYSYSFDTSQDTGFFGAQSQIDAYMEKVPGFNHPHHKPRKVWQSGHGPSGTSRFWIRVPMFLKLRDNEWKGEPPEHLHEWVKEADRRSRNYRANPSRPAVFGYEGRVLKNIGECDPPRLVRGDGVALTFSISYIIGHRDWYPTYALIDVVRIASEGNVVPSTRADGLVVLHPPLRQALQAGEVLGASDVDDWELEDIPSEVRNVSLAALTKDTVRNEQDHGDSEMALIRPATRRPAADALVDIMDVDDTGPASSVADLAAVQSSQTHRGNSTDSSSSRTSSLSPSPPTDESLNWSDSAIEDGHSPIVAGYGGSMHSEGEEFEALKSKRRRRRVVYRR